MNEQFTFLHEIESTLKRSNRISLIVFSEGDFQIVATLDHKLKLQIRIYVSACEVQRLSPFVQMKVKDFLDVVYKSHFKEE